MSRQYFGNQLIGAWYDSPISPSSHEILPLRMKELVDMGRASWDERTDCWHVDGVPYEYEENL